jgi:leucyl-tRNA synthetase
MDADEVEYPVQINGKMRGKLVLARSLAGPALEQAVRDHADVVRLCEGKQIRKLIVVPGKIVNIVA